MSGDVEGFMREIGAIYSESHAAGREIRGQAYLNFEQWDRWREAAVRSKLVPADELDGEGKVPNYDNFNGAGFSAAVIRVSILRTWARVAESMQLGLTPEQHFRNELDAMNRRDAVTRHKEQTAAARESRAKRNDHTGG